MPSATDLWRGVKAGVELIAGGVMRLLDASSNAVGFKAPASVTPIDYTIPSAGPSVDGQALICTAAGVSSWGGPYAALVGATFTGPIAETANSANGTSAILVSGTTYVGTTPHILRQPTGTSSPTWNSNGTTIGIAEVSGFSGCFLDFHVANAASVFQVQSSGFVATNSSIQIGAGANFYFASRTRVGSSSDGTLQITNNAQSANATVTIAALNVTGLNGATAGLRIVGATASGAPGSGTFIAGDVAFAQNGHLWMCTVGGSPGTWTMIA